MAEVEEFDSQGWNQIHRAAHGGYILEVDFNLNENRDLLELETKDDKLMTPFLCAVDGNKMKAVKYLLESGARTDVINAQNHGAVEICALKIYIEMLKYLIEIDNPMIPVWKNLIRFFDSESEEEAEAAGKCLRVLTDRLENNKINPSWEQFYNNGGVNVIVRVARSSLSDEAKIPAFQTLLNLIERLEVQEQISSSGGIIAFITLLKSTNHYVIQLSAEILDSLATNQTYALQISQNNGIPALVKVLQDIHDYEVLIPAVHCLGNLAESETKIQAQVGTSHGCIPQLVVLFEEFHEHSFLVTLSNVVGKIANNDETNQNNFINAGIVPHIISLLNIRSSKDIQMSAVDTIYKLSIGNDSTQKAMVGENIHEHMLKMLRVTRIVVIQEKTALALWAISGSDFDIKRYIAEQIGAFLLVQFANALSSDKLHFMGSECLCILAQGPLNYQTEIAKSHGIPALLKLLSSSKVYIVLSVIRTLRFICLGVGYVPNRNNQNTLLRLGSIKNLMALMVLSEDETVQIEAAIALAAVSLGNQHVLDEIKKFPEFTYVRILKLMYSADPNVRLLAGLALATFAYNNLTEQKEIAEQGGVRFNSFRPFLHSETELFRCLGAFQVVVLARIIPDTEQALSSAAGIKLLIDLVQDSTDNEILALSCDCIARLSHTRAGIPSAFLSIDTVDHLCHLLLKNVEQVRGCAAIALGYLSFNHTGERQILNRCRANPYMMKILLHYTQRSKISPAMLEGWRHYRKVGLPPIDEDQQNLIGYNPPGNGPITPSDETNYSSNTSPVTQYLAGKESRLTNRTSRSGSKQHEEGTITGTLHTEASFKSSNLSLDLVDSLRSTSTDTKS
ncbi:ankyrin and armadillo repeat-containing protein-like [Mytilus edulis]|uniref:Ankyrin and armadillo repeat-containing protein n=2 Tax=Mytilus TaxID=6548 RepID=A0A8B6BKU5_MYTGA|nr:unnamed protein product [Mytilus edulis]VDH91654.1 Hypothetical predicted protein [Mytilus galloprovincialis]